MVFLDGSSCLTCSARLFNSFFVRLLGVWSNNWIPNDFRKENKTVLIFSTTSLRILKTIVELLLVLIFQSLQMDEHKKGTQSPAVFHCTFFLLKHNYENYKGKQTTRLFIYLNISLRYFYIIPYFVLISRLSGVWFSLPCWPLVPNWLVIWLLDATCWYLPLIRLCNGSHQSPTIFPFIMTTPSSSRLLIIATMGITTLSS